jgi:hypothetical protein
MIVVDNLNKTKVDIMIVEVPRIDFSGNVEDPLTNVSAFGSAE